MTGSDYFQAVQVDRQDHSRATPTPARSSGSGGHFYSSARDSGINSGNRNLKEILDYEPIVRLDSRQRINKEPTSVSPIQFGGKVESFNQYLLESRSSPKELHRRIISHVDDSAGQKISALMTEAAAYKANIAQLETEKGIYIFTVELLLKTNQKLEHELNDTKEQSEKALRSHVDQLNAKLKDVNKKIESYEQMQSEVEVLRNKNTSLMRANAELKISAEEAEFSNIELQKYKSKCGSMKEEVEFLQKQKVELIQGQNSQRWQTENSYQQEIIELKQRLQRMTSQISDSESRLIESENKRIELRRQLDSVKSESPSMYSST